MLALLLTGSANAGIMQNESPAPPPPTPTAVQEPTTDGNMNTGATAPAADGIMGNDAAATLIKIVLNLLALT